MKIEINHQEWEVISSPDSDKIRKILENGTTFTWITKETKTSVAYDSASKQIFVACPLNIAEKYKKSLVFAMKRELEE